MSRFKVLAINSDQTFCMCCGKRNLTRVVWIEDTELGVVKHFGTICAQEPEKGFKLGKQIKDAVRADDRRRKAVSDVAHRLYRRAGGKYEFNVEAQDFIPVNLDLFDELERKTAASIK